MIIETYMANLYSKRRIILSCFATLAVFAMAACSTIERSYDYQGYKKMLEKREFIVEETKAVAEITTDGVKSTIEYTYDAEESMRWVGTYIEEEDGEEVEIKTYQPLNLKDYVSALPGTAIFLKRDVDDIFRFYAKKDEYRITIKNQTEDGLQTGESRYNKDGLCIYSYSALKDKNGLIKNEETINYSYSK